MITCVGGDDYDEVEVEEEEEDDEDQEVANEDQHVFIESLYFIF